MQARIKDSLAGYQRDTYTNHNSLQLEAGVAYLDCALGTNPFGCSPAVLRSSAPPEMLFSSYPTPNTDFLQRIREHWQNIAPLSETNIHLEVGSFGVIERLNKLFIDEKSVVLGYCPQFSDYRQDVLCCGGKFEFIKLNPSDNYKFKASELISALNSRHKLVYLDNPNNPTGQVIPLSEIETVVKAAQDLDIVVLIDEAFGDFMEKENSSIALIPKYSNLFVARSFTKGYGLAGLRVGYVVMSDELSKPYSLVAHPFPVTALGQYYAEIALADQEFIQNCKYEFSVTKKILQQSCQKLSIAETDPDTPILTLIHPNPELNLFNEFLKRRILTTSGEHFIGLGPNSVRLRLPKERDQLLAVIREIDTLV